MAQSRALDPSEYRIESFTVTVCLLYINSISCLLYNWTTRKVTLLDREVLIVARKLYTWNKNQFTIKHWIGYQGRANENGDGIEEVILDSNYITMCHGRRKLLKLFNMSRERKIYLEMRFVKNVEKFYFKPALINTVSSSTNIRLR